MLNFVFGVSANETNEVASYIKNIDIFYKALKPVSASVKRILLTDLWQEMVDLKLEPVANYISNTYLIAVAKTLNDTELVNTLKNYNNISIGHKAPDFSFIDKNKTTKKLSELNDANTYIIIFWSSTCSHCLDEIPKLKELIKTHANTKTKVIAIALEEDEKRWKELIKNYPEFTHVLGLGKWDNSIGNAYHVQETPTYFVLDKNKNIIEKPHDVYALKTFLEK